MSCLEIIGVYAIVSVAIIAAYYGVVALLGGWRASTELDRRPTYRYVDDEYNRLNDQVWNHYRDLNGRLGELEAQTKSKGKKA